jgi:hypothetical protein
VAATTLNSTVFSYWGSTLHAELKLKQATAFGACQTRLVAAHWTDAGEQLRKLADIEAAIKEAILRI